MSEPDKKSNLGIYGGIATAIYFAAAYGILFHTDWIVPEALKLNEFGDLLAGLFGPPALIWVVISFYIQSAELRNSVNALNLQAEELRKSVEQQIAMVELTKEANTHEKSLAERNEIDRIAKRNPNFIFTENGIIKSGVTSTVKYKIVNTGSDVANVACELLNLSDPSKNTARQFAEPFLKKGDELAIAFNVILSENDQNELKAKINYEDVDGNIGERSFTIVVKNTINTVSCNVRPHS